ncbi:MAG: hypothetical protein D3916_15515 [Candidatus Electrothrix sp. MAN1_4]|nr:hypothetical protein [Candidatus Electrothrix sp. MAN1_4]
MSRFSFQQGQLFLINAIYQHHLKSSLAPVLSANKNNTGKIIVAVSTPHAKNVTSATGTIRITVENVINVPNVLRRKNRAENMLSTRTVTNARQHIPQKQSRPTRYNAGSVVLSTLKELIITATGFNADHAVKYPPVVLTIVAA